MPKIFGQTAHTDVKNQEDTVTTTTDAPAATGQPMTSPPASGPAENPSGGVLDGVKTDDTRKRGRPKLADLPPVPVDAFGNDEEVPADQYGEYELTESSKTAPRSPAQLLLDERVKRIHTAWVEAGRPALKLAPRRKFVVDPEHEAATRGMLTAAGAKNKVRVIQDATHTPQGKVVITYTAVDRPPAVKKSAKTSAETPAS